MPKLSLIVPIYNVAPWLCRCLDSILRQTLNDVEILAVNDGSTDESPRILEEYAEAHPGRIQIFHKENGGLSDARNFGLAHATGEYVAFVDSDDTLHPDFARLTVEKMEAEGLDLLLTDFYFTREDGSSTPASALLYKEGGQMPLITASPMAWLRVYKRSLLPAEPFCKGLYYEDLDMTPRALLSAKKAGYLPTPLYYYYQRAGSIMKEKAFSPKWLDIFTVLERLRGYFKEAGKENAHAELEFLHIEHLLRSAALRFAPFREGRKQIPSLIQTVEAHFPNWKKNPYFSKTSLYFRLVVFCKAHRLTPLLQILAKLKG
ncbi:MAG: glycosyltransferase [Clostridia bacterium]|nr:glycosyltransferase [Clostridia bacterium]